MPERPTAVLWRDCPSCRCAQFLAHQPYARRWVWSCGSCGRADAGKAPMTGTTPTTALDTWQESLTAVHGHEPRSAVPSAWGQIGGDR